MLGLVYIEYRTVSGQQMVTFNNLTIINLLLKTCGPMHERNVTVMLLVAQFICSIVAFAVRYPLAYLLFGEIIV